MQRKDGHLSLRLAANIVDSLDAEAAMLEAASPGMRVTRADVARKYLLQGMVPGPNNNLAELRQLFFIESVLDLFAKNEEHSALWWRTDGEYAPVTFMVNCNDEFYWGTADAEPITSDNLAVLEQSYKDVTATGFKFAEVYGAMLFCARVRKERPQHAAYPRFDKRAQTENNISAWRALVDLFDAAGPPREVNSGNPYPHPYDDPNNIKQED